MIAQRDLPPLGAAIRRARRLTRRTQAQIAKRAGLSRQRIQRIETCGRPRPAELAAIAAATNTTARALHLDAAQIELTRASEQTTRLALSLISAERARGDET